MTSCARTQVASLSLLLATGCATYRPVSGNQLAAGMRVRVQLTSEGSRALAPALGAAVTGVEGDWIRASGDSIDVHVARLLTASGVTVAWTGAPVSLSRDAVQTVQRSTVGRARTIALVGGAIAAVVTFVIAIQRDGSAKGESSGGGAGAF